LTIKSLQENVSRETIIEKWKGGRGFVPPYDIWTKVIKGESHGKH